MKRFLLFFVAALLFVACDNKFEDEGNTIQRVSTLPTLTAEFAEDATRTYVEDNSYLRWHEGDLISAFVGNSRNSKYIFDGKTGDNSGEFEPVSSNSSGEVYDLNRNCALYPYDEDATVDSGGSISCSLPAVQEYAEESFGKGANTMVAVTKDVDDTFLAFKNVCGYLKIKLYGKATVKSIELKGNNGEKIAGEVGIRTNYGSAPVVKWFAGTDSITLDCGEGVKLSTDAENPTEFWFVVPPTEFSKGLTIVVTDIYGVSFEKSTSNMVVVNRNEIQPMAAVEAIFRDPNKPAYNEIWYTSSDGKITIPLQTNSFGANIVSNTYENGKGVITFDGNVTMIGDITFYNNCNLTSITIPDSVTTFGNAIFARCIELKEFNSKYASSDGRCLIIDGVLNSFAPAGLTEYIIPDSVTTIGKSAFYNCDSLTSVTIPDSVTTIGDYTFYWCDKLTSVTIPDSVTTIGDEAFESCDSLTSVTIPNSVTTIGEEAFSNCTNLESVYCKATTPSSLGSGAFDYYNNDEYEPIGCMIYVPRDCGEVYRSADGWIEYADYIVEYDFETGEVVPEEVQPKNEIWYTSINGEIVETYSTDVFGANIVSNTYEDGKGVITFDGEVSMIGNKAFYGCESLETIIIPSSVATIDISAFQNCTSLFEVKFDKKSKLAILEGSFSKYSNSYSGVFANCKSLQYINIPSSVTEIKAGAFQGCDNLLEVTFEENSSLKTIGGGYCLYDDSTYFSHYSIARYGAFAFCSSLKEIIIPSSVETIEPCAFIGCSSLSSVSFEKGGNLRSLKGGYVYKKYGTKIYYEASSTFGCFENCYALTSICIPSSVEIIEACAFQNCISLSEVTFEQGSRLKECGDGCSGGTYYTFITGAFAQCSSLKSIIIPASVEHIGIGTFNQCSSLTSVEFEANSCLSTIGGAHGSIDAYSPSDQGTKEYGAFSHCTALTSIIIPECVTNIGVVAFSNCDSLTSVTIGDGVTTIDEEAFSSCNNLTNVTIGNSVTKIGEYAFEHCAGLTSVTIPNSVTSIEWGAFSYCTSLTSVYCKATTPPTLGGYVFSDTNIETIYVPTGSVETYKTSGWKNYAHCIEGYDF